MIEQREVHPVLATMIDPRELASAVMATAVEFLALVREIPAEQSGAGVPGMDWTAAEVAAHVVTVLRRGLDDARRAATLEELGELNATCIAEVTEREPSRLADMLEADLGAIAARGVDPDDLIELHVGVVADRLTASSYFLGDLLVHGHDIARATGQPWTIDPARAAVCLRAALPAMRPWVAPQVLGGVPQCATLGLGDSGTPVLVSVGGGEYSATAGTREEVDRTDADGATTLLAITRQVPSGDAVLDRVASWFLPI